MHVSYNEYILAIVAESLTENKVISPRILRSNGDVKKSTEPFEMPAMQAKTKAKTKAKSSRPKPKSKKKVEDSTEEKVKREVLADSSDKETQVKREVFANQAKTKAETKAMMSHATTL